MAYNGFHERIVYRTDWRTAAAAIAISFLGVAATLPLYWRWWRLGRSVTLSPVEIAKAFGAPLLRGVNSNATAHEMAHAASALAVRYGAVPASPAATAAGAAADEEQDEYGGEVWDTGDGAAEDSLEDGSAGSAERMELRSGTAASVETPRQGMKFA